MLDYFPQNVSTIGAEHDALFGFIYYLTVGIFFLVTILFVVFLWKYRRQDGKRAYHFHGSNMVEFTWTLLPTLLFGALGVYSDDLWRDYKYQSHVPNPDVEIEVLGQQFMWHIHYPGADGILGRRGENDEFRTSTNVFGIDPSDPNGLDDIVVQNVFKLPINKTVVVNLSSVDVLHSFFLPHFRVKQDAVPGLWNKLAFDGDRTGDFELACAELCGTGHSLMRGVLEMMSEEDYNAWMDKKIAAKLASMAPEESPAETGDAMEVIETSAEDEIVTDDEAVE